MFDTSRSFFNDLRERPLAAGASLVEEAQVMVLVSDGVSGTAVQPSAGAASELFAGFAITDAKKVATEVVVETVTVPSSSPYQVTLRNSNIIVAESRAYDNTTSSAMAFTCPTPAATQYCVTTAGLLSFNSAQAGDTVTIYYRCNLTVAQAMDKFHQRNVSNTAQDYFSTVALGCLEGEIFTSMYLASDTFTLGGLCYSGAAGKITTTSTGALVGYVSKLPTVADPLLGVIFKTTI